MASEQTVDAGTLHDIKPLPEFRPFPLELVLSLLFLLLTAFIARRLLKRHAAKLALAPIPVVPPADEALHGLRELQLLREKGNISVRELACRASMILRLYVEREIGFAATDQTVSEIRSHFPAAISARLAALEQAARAELENRIVALLRLFERMAFADDSTKRFSLQSEELGKALEECERFVFSIRDAIAEDQARRAAAEAQSLTAASGGVSP